jgi:hypothetical protein
MGTVKLELKSPGELLDEITRLRKALKDIVRSNPCKGRLETPATRIARNALSNGDKT